MSEKTIERRSRIDALALLVVGALLAVFFFPLAGELVHFWQSDQESTHGFLIPAISFYLLWLNREKLRPFWAQPSIRTYSSLDPIALVLALVLYAFTGFTEMILLQGLALVLVLLTSVRFLFGKEVLRIALLPLLFLVFMLPIPFPIYNAMAGPMKQFVANLSAFLISILGISVELDGNTLHLPTISLLVHETCSGIRTLISFLALGILIAALFLKGLHHRAIVIGVAIVMALFVNVLRVAAIGVVSYVWSNDAALQFHSHGWILITPLGLLAIFFISNHLQCRDTIKDC